MNCTKCGNPLDAGAKFCTKCGNTVQAGPVNAAPDLDRTVSVAGNGPIPTAAQYQAPQPQYQAPQPQYQAPQTNVNINFNQLKNSTWDGEVLDTIVNSIIASLIISISCGIATPWAICYMMKFVIGHAIIDGKRLSFNGTGGDLFAQWIKWFLLTVITCGIYSFWVTPRLYKWIAEHIHTEG